MEELNFQFPQSGDHPYQRRSAVLTSKHQKLALIERSFLESCGLLVTEAALDTDQFGTFSGEVERTLPPLETAILKARLGMGVTGIRIGLASEGSIGADPIVPFLTSDIEQMVLVDDERGIVISETYRSLEIIAVRKEILPMENLTEFLGKADFPHHKLIAKPKSTGSTVCFKAISSLTELESALDICFKSSPTGVVVLESDLRANHSPSRQKNIRRLADLLASRVGRLCPKCSTPGWGRVSYLRGLRCGLCSRILPKAIREEVLGCVSCEFTQSGAVIAEVADPAICIWCNP